MRRRNAPWEQNDNRTSGNFTIEGLGDPPSNKYYVTERWSALSELLRLSVDRPKYWYSRAVGKTLSGRGDRCGKPTVSVVYNS